MWGGTFGVALPNHVFEASAPGYVTSQRFHLDSFGSSVKDAYPVSTLDVKTRLSMSPSVPTK